MTCPLSLSADASDASSADRFTAFLRRAGELAHDLNNAFTPITGFATLVRDDLASTELTALDPAALASDLDFVIASTRRGVELTRELIRLVAAEQSVHPPHRV
ncbi:MAG: hypothetical protein H0W68_01305 [Gemmatimonadaceae bacterium]|nr:hypothetical protein [Gemmatimonadaceae bacterium]